MTATVQPGHPFQQKDLVAVGSKVGRVVCLADDEPLLLIRWEGGHICDWVRAEELVYADESAGPSRHKERVGTDKES